MIDPRLRVLQLVAHHGTVTAVAKSLNYTPSAVSHQLRQLSEDLGVTLLVQSGRGIRLTSAAHTVLRDAAVMFAQEERARAELTADPEQVTGSFTMCGFSTAATRLLPQAAAQLRGDFPETTVRVIEAEPARCFDLLLSADADLALYTATSMTPSSSDPRFDQVHLVDDPLDLVVPQDHPLARRKSVELSDAAEEPWIVGRPDSAYYHLVIAACMNAGFSPNVAHQADEWETGTALVAHGFGVILVPKLARLHADWPVTRVPLRGDPAPTRRIFSATRSGARGHPLITAALDALPVSRLL